MYFSLLVIVLLFVFPGSLQAQNRFDVVITEIMADPSPPVGLPATEWIELKNNSAIPVNLQQWRIADAANQSGPMPAFLLQPDSVVIICSNSALPALSAWGAAIALTSFPALDNEGELIFLKAPNGLAVHAVEYSAHWYDNEVKKQGGWSLEMIDPANPCSGRGNWGASIHPSGGTPGKKNSLDAPNPDHTAPQWLKAHTTDSLHIILEFDEPLDSLAGATLSNYAADRGITFFGAECLAPLFHTVRLQTNQPLAPSMVYTITAKNIKDCKENAAGLLSARLGLPSDPGPGEWIINEILFNPRPGGEDYVELYNNSNKIFDAATLFIAGRQPNGSTGTIKKISERPCPVFPGDYLVLTEDAASLQLHYLVKYPGQVIEINGLPSLPDDKGNLLLLDAQGTVTDELNYSKDWHFKLLSDPEGVSLERIDPTAPTQYAANWHSAASTAGYGTPGYQNSQFKVPGPLPFAISVSPKVFSPDNDGRDDWVSIRYELAEPGYIAHITLFDAAGRPVRRLVQNALLGNRGSWNWDGLDDTGKRLPSGIYILLAELFNLQGKKDKFKQAIVLAGLPGP